MNRAIFKKLKFTSSFFILTLIVSFSSCDNSKTSVENKTDNVTVSKKFNGDIQMDIRDSKADWSAFQPKKAKQGAPNVLFILYDDTGLGAWSTYGGGVNMPTLDAIAADGVTYTQWNNTALCSPTRSTLLTGRNHHLNGMATLTEAAEGFPGMTGIVPLSSAPMAKILQANGYSTFWIGKNHNVPVQHIKAAGNLSYWPLGMGFDHFYGFLGGETNNWYPDLVEDNKFVSAPATPEEGYHLSKDLATKAISYLKDVRSSAPDKPWYMWFNPGANHAPHHSPKDYADKYKGKFDEGYEAYRKWVVERMKQKGIVPEDTQLTPINPLGKGTLNSEMVRPWNSLNDDEKKLFARMAEVWAGFSEYTDAQIGRIVDYLKETGQYENTMIIWAADNGTSGEGTPNGSVNENKMFNSYPDDFAENLKNIDELGGPNTYNHFPTGWAAAFNGPLKMFKRYSYAGGVNSPLIISWPAGMKSKGEIRNQYHHSVDIVPTILEAAGIEMPAEFEGVEQTPLSGVSMVYSFDAEPNGKTEKETQYYAMLGTRGIWHNGWKAITTHPALAGTGGFENDTWELYHTAVDRSESNNLAKENPEKLEELKKLWMQEADKNNVLPLDDRSMAQIVDDQAKAMKEHPELIANSYRYYPFTSPMSESNSIMVRGRDFKMLANVEITNATEGVIFAHGSRFGGHTLFVQGGKLHYIYNFLGVNIQEFVSDIPLTSGKHVVGVEFKKESMGERREINGQMKLFIDNKVVAQGPLMTQSGIFSLSGEGICVGYDNGDVVSTKYKSPGTFKNGSIQFVELNATGTPYLDLEVEMQRKWATQ